MNTTLSCQRLFFLSVVLINIIGCSKQSDEDGVTVIKSIFPANAGVGDTITVSGKNLPTDISSVKFTINSRLAKIISASSETLQAEVPLMAGSGKVELTIGAKIYTGPEMKYDYEVIVTTIAGNGSTGRDDGPGTIATFYCPWGIAVDKNDNLFVADCYNRLIRRISASNFFVSSYTIPTIVGADNFYSPYNITVDKVSDDVYVTDFNKHLMRMDPMGQMSVIYSGDMPLTGIAIAPDRKNLFITNNVAGTILKTNMDGSNATVFTSGLITPRNIIINNQGKMFVAACPNPIYEINSNGTASSVVNFSDFKGWEIAVDTLGNFYLADHFDNSIKMIERSGKGFTIAGSGEASDVDGRGPEASFNGPMGITIDSKGNLYVTTFNYDTYGGNKVRKIKIR